MPPEPRKSENQDITQRSLTDVASPFLIWSITIEVAIQQARREFELVIAVGCDLVFVGPYARYAVLTHQRPTRRCPTSKPISFSSSVIRGRP